MLKNKIYIILMLFCLDKKIKSYDYDLVFLGFKGLKFLNYPIFKLKKIIPWKLINFEIPKIKIFGYKPKGWLILPFLTKLIHNKLNEEFKDGHNKKELGIIKTLNPFNFYNICFYKIIELNKKNKIIKKIVYLNNIINNDYISWVWNWIIYLQKIHIVK